MSGNAFSFSFPSLANVAYTLQYITNVTQTNWVSIISTNGNGSVMSLSDPAATSAARFYRVMAN
jgi:hypothetical protein